MNFLSENFPFLVVKFSIYLNRRVFVMATPFVVSTYSQSFILVIRFKKNPHIFIFIIVKMAAKYTKVNSVGSLDSGFQQNQLV